MTPPNYLVALITPFDDHGDLDLDAHRHNLRLLHDSGVTGFVLGGSNGEGQYLEPGERAALTVAVRETLGDGAYLMVSVMAETVRGGLGQLEEITGAGADAALVLTPTTLTRGRPEYVARYFRSIAEAAELPVFLYSVPPNTGYSLEEDVVAELAEHPNIHGMKDSSGDPVRIQRIVGSTPDEFLVWSGSSQAVLLSVTAGAYGVITGSGNYAPKLVLDTLGAARTDPLEARAPQQQLSALSRAIERHGIPGVKAAAKAAGLEPGYPRAPLAPLPRTLAEEIAARVTAI